MTTTDPFAEAALAEAWARHPDPVDVKTGEPVDDWGFEEEGRKNFLAGVEWARTYLAAQETTDTGHISDGYHTFDELYEYRMLYNAHAATGWLAAGFPVVKSWRHSDGDLCFGGGWFIVTAELPSGQVSNHYAAEHWGLFDVPEVDLPPAYDGHTPQDVAHRLREACVARRDEDNR